MDRFSAEHQHQQQQQQQKVPHQYQKHRTRSSNQSQLIPPPHLHRVVQLHSFETQLSQHLQQHPQQNPHHLHFHHQPLSPITSHPLQSSGQLLHPQSNHYQHPNHYHYLPSNEQPNNHLSYRHQDELQSSTISEVPEYSYQSTTLSQMGAAPVAAPTAAPAPTAATVQSIKVSPSQRRVMLGDDGADEDVNEQFSVEHEIKFTKAESCNASTCACLFVGALLATFAIMSGLHYGLNFFDGRQIRERVFAGQFLILDFDSLAGQLENPDSFEFTRHAAELKQKFDDIFTHTRLSSAYIRTDIVAFEAPKSTPKSPNGVLVHFDVRISSQTSLAPSASDLYLVMANRLTSKANSPFTGQWSVDIDSLELRERRWQPREHYSAAYLANPWTERSVIPGILENIPAEPEPRQCGAIELTYCRSVLHYNATSYPNVFGHSNLTALEEDFQLYKEIIDSECSVLARPFLCSLAQPECRDNVPILPCRDFCRQFVTDCRGWLSPKLLNDVLANCLGFQDPKSSSNQEELQTMTPTGAIDNNGRQEQRISKQCQAAPNCSSILRAKGQAWKLCDGVNDCRDGSDELFCDYCRLSPSSASLGEPGIEFHCGIRQCIPQTAVCDGTKDCANGADEMNCLAMLNETTNDAASSQMLSAESAISVSGANIDGIGEHNGTSGYLIAKHKGRSLLVCANEISFITPPQADREHPSVDATDDSSFLNISPRRPSSSQFDLDMESQLIKPTVTLGKNLCDELAYEQLTSIEARRTSLNGPFSRFVPGTTFVSSQTSASCPENEILFVECRTPKCGIATQNIMETSSPEVDEKFHYLTQQHPESDALLGDVGGGGGGGSGRSTGGNNSSLSRTVTTESIAAYPGHWPWIVKIVSNGEHLCEGTLISVSTVLTQGPCWAHRSSGPANPANLTAIVGSVRLYSGDNREARRIAVVAVSSVRPQGARLLELGDSIRSNAIVRPICLRPLSTGRQHHPHSTSTTPNSATSNNNGDAINDSANMVCYVTGFNVETDRLESRRAHLVGIERCTLNTPQNQNILSQKERNAELKHNRTQNARIDRLANKICVHLPVGDSDRTWAPIGALNTQEPLNDGDNEIGRMTASLTSPNMNSTTNSTTGSGEDVLLGGGNKNDGKVSETLSLGATTGRHLFCMHNKKSWILYASETVNHHPHHHHHPHQQQQHPLSQPESIRHFRYFDILKLHS